MGSLKDQLLASGLTDKQAVKNARKKKQPKLAKKERNAQSKSAKQAEQALLEKAQRDKKLNQQRQLEAEKKAQVAQVKQLVERSKLQREDAQICYSFTFDKKVKNIYVTPQQQKQLSLGQVSIIALSEDKYELVPNVVAEKISLRDQSYVVNHLSQASDKTDQDDPYADYQIPDDLIW
ncbi:MAG: DUF2058 domain-containing protein [Acidiferrobacterales bacterium]|nr:DUF2058 domain-containing protein [Acidiferrobacterales bacterium]